MSQPIPTQSKPQLQQIDMLVYTPSSTPPPPTVNQASSSSPSFFESRLHKILESIDAGTHQFCRAEREDENEQQDLAKAGVTWSNGALPTPPPSRRPSFLSHLTLSRPLITPLSNLPNPQTQPNPSTSPTGWGPTQNHQRPEISPLGQMTQSTPNIPGQTTLPTSVSRAVSTPLLPKRVEGFTGVKSSGMKMNLKEGRTHFDPSREPKLLGLL